MLAHSSGEEKHRGWIFKNSPVKVKYSTAWSADLKSHFKEQLAGELESPRWYLAEWAPQTHVKSSRGQPVLTWAASPRLGSQSSPGRCWKSQTGKEERKETDRISPRRRLLVPQSAAAALNGFQWAPSRSSYILVLGCSLTFSSVERGMFFPWLLCC